MTLHGIILEWDNSEHTNNSSFIIEKISVLSVFMKNRIFSFSKPIDEQSIFSPS